MMAWRMSDSSPDDSPTLSVRPLEIGKEADVDVWRIGWVIANFGSKQAEIFEAWLPHGRFRGDREAFSPSRVVAAGESTLFYSVVRCSAEPGEIVENAFLILRVGFRAREWRVFTRLRIERTSLDSIELAVEKVTVHPVGFLSEKEGRWR